MDWKWTTWRILIIDKAIIKRTVRNLTLLWYLNEEKLVYRKCIGLVCSVRGQNKRLPSKSVFVFYWNFLRFRKHLLEYSGLEKASPTSYRTLCVFLMSVHQPAPRFLPAWIGPDPILNPLSCRLMDYIRQGLQGLIAGPTPFTQVQMRWPAAHSGVLQKTAESSYSVKSIKWIQLFEISSFVLCIMLF